MKYLTKENILLAMVGFLFLVQANDMRKSRKGPERSRGAIMERMRGMDRSDWGARMEGMRKAKKGKVEEVSISPGITCCDQKLPCCDQKLPCCDQKLPCCDQGLACCDQGLACCDQDLACCDTKS